MRDFSPDLGTQLIQDIIRRDRPYRFHWSIGIHRSNPNNPLSLIRGLEYGLTRKDQDPASHHTRLDGGLVVSGDWLVQGGDDFTQAPETPESAAPGHITLLRSGHAPGCAITLMMRISGRMNAVFDPTRTRLNIFRVHGRTDVLVLRSYAGSTRQEFLGIGILRFEANQDDEPWRVLRDFQTTVRCLKMSNSDRKERRVGDNLASQVELADGFPAQFGVWPTSVWRAPTQSPMGTQLSGFASLSAFWGVDSNRIWVEDSNRYQDLGKWARKKGMRDDIKHLRGNWNQFQDLETTLGGRPPTDGLLSSLITTHDPVSEWIGAEFITSTQEPALTVRNINLWFCLLVQLVVGCSPINPLNDLYFRAPKNMMLSYMKLIRETLFVYRTPHQHRICRKDVTTPSDNVSRRAPPRRPGNIATTQSSDTRLWQRQRFEVPGQL
jgi:hypothetical protein